jgi:hypothetical protein
MRHHVLGLDVPVDHALTMRVPQRRAHIGRNADRLRQRKLPLSVELLAQRLAVHERHHVVEEVARLAGIEQGEDVGVL